MKLFLSILHTVLKYVLDYLSAATITLKSDILQLIQSSWSFLTFQIIGIKHYKLYCRCFCSYSQQSCHFSLYLLTCYNTYFCTASLNGSLVIWTVSGLFPCLRIMRTFSAVKKMHLSGFLLQDIYEEIIFMPAGLKIPQDKGWGCHCSGEQETCISLLGLASQEAKQRATGRKQNYSSLYTQ